MSSIDLNCDMGESYGAWRMGQDEAVMPLISSANIACGFHAGDPDIMRRTVRLARTHGVAIGAHVSLPDLQGFGRRELKVSADEAYALTLYQIGALAAFARVEGMRLNHVKAHGALYNMAARDVALAGAIARATRDFDPGLVLYALSGSAMIGVARDLGLQVANEAFADRRYESDGSLTPRREPDAVIHDATQAAVQLTQLLRTGALRSRQGSEVRIAVDTVCLHGDRDDAAVFAAAVRNALQAEAIEVRAIARESST